MSHHTRRIEVGIATVSVMNVGDIEFRLSDELVIPEDKQDAAIAARLEQPARFPTQCFHIALPGASVLIDACNYTRSFPPSSPYFLPGYQPPPGLVTQLGEQGVRSEDITHLVITHAHFDHYSGTTTECNGQMVPCFPLARCFLGRADWEQSEMQKALQELHSQDGSTLGVLYQRRLLELVEGERELVPGIQIIPAPGESAGHQIVRIHSQGQTLYCLGDLYHDPVEVEHPDWMTSWADFNTNLSSRQALIQAALDEQALLAAAHIAGIGRVEHTSSGLKWKQL
jgi:glyoxylase-like metal-dependent hydrolase (beta-lactamase superfamily II)